jgi:hypothetical protein
MAGEAPTAQARGQRCRGRLRPATAARQPQPPTVARTAVRSSAMQLVRANGVNFQLAQTCEPYGIRPTGRATNLRETDRSLPEATKASKAGSLRRLPDSPYGRSGEAAPNLTEAGRPHIRGAPSSTRAGSFHQGTPSRASIRKRT